MSDIWRDIGKGFGIEKVKRWKNAKSYQQWYQSLNDYAMPTLATIRVDKISTNDILNCLEPIWYDKPETANRVRARIGAVMDWCRVRGYCSGVNPASWRGNLDTVLPSRYKIQQPKHHEAPTIQELKTVVEYCMAHPSPVSGALLMVIATATRITEVRGALAEEIIHGIWNIPADRMKAKKPHRVPLSTLADVALSMAKDKGLLFTHQGKQLGSDSPRVKLTMIVGRKVTVHGIRSTFRDWCAREKVPDAVAEKCLAHAYGDKTVQAYFRDDLLDHRKSVMQKWADLMLK
ncbi:MAG: site-specific integrase [Sutterellaceae bacterium]|nr:site-specific integrase [Sutterellaceae bacterium]